MGKIVLNTVYNVYMYEHVVICVLCRKATYIHLFYSIVPLFWVCGLNFCMYYYFSYRAGHMALPSEHMWQYHSSCGPAIWCEHGGNTPLFSPWFMTFIFNSFRWCFIHWYARECIRCSQSASILGCILGLVEGSQLNC